ncbi:MAG: hypothetical protein IT378_10470, partial [Sandaracinaceae bacterium]|nr:hypothetical protein [Sandaracinaceae bacterium]
LEASGARLRVLEPVPLAEPTPIDGASVPRFRTWYDRDDVARVFHRLYEDLGPEGRAARASFGEASLDGAFAWNPQAVESLDNWPADRLAAYVAALDDPQAVGGVGGIRRITMSPDAARHAVASYAPIVECARSGAPAYDRPAAPATAFRRVARVPVALAPCSTQRAGPYAIAAGEELRIGLEASGARLRVLEGAEIENARLRCDTALECRVRGPGVYFATVESEGEPYASMLEVDLAMPPDEWASCLSGPFPLASATVAAEWRRSDGLPLPVYDTSAQTLARFAEDPSWVPSGEADPDPSSIYTMSLPTGTTFRLAGMHIRTRELDHWVYITMWWSPEPDTDFGADRTEAVHALGGPWANYKMCVVVDYDEHDPEPAGGVEDETLASALAAVHAGVGSPTWCSNPYIDGAPGLAISNCIGCHQHAFTGVTPADVATTPDRYPLGGRTRSRHDFPADYFWGLDTGDQLADLFNREVTWWDTAPQ